MDVKRKELNKRGVIEMEWNPHFYEQEPTLPRCWIRIQYDRRRGVALVDAGNELNISYTSTVFKNVNQALFITNRLPADIAKFLCHTSSRRVSGRETARFAPKGRLPFLLDFFLAYAEGMERKGLAFIWIPADNDPFREAFAAAEAKSLDVPMPAKRLVRKRMGD